VLKKLKSIIEKLLKLIWHYLHISLKFITSDLFLRIVGALLIMLAIYFDEILPNVEYPILKPILSVITGSLFLFYNPLSKAVSTYTAKKKKRKKIQNQLKPVLRFLKQQVNLNLDTAQLLNAIDSSEIDFFRKDSIIVFVINSVESLNQVQKDAIILITLCNEIENEVDILKSESYKTAVSAIFEKYNFIELDEGAKTIIKYYYNYLNGKSLQTEASEIDFWSITDQVTRKYNKTYNLSFRLKLERDQSEEFRRTLSILIKDGKLNIKQLEKSLQDKIKVELQDIAIKSKAFLVLSQKFQNIPEIQQALDRFPHVKFPPPKPSRLPGSIKYVSTRIIYPSSAFQDAEDFLMNEIAPLIPPDRMNDGFIAVIPIEGTELYSIPENADYFEKSYLIDGFESIAAYKTGLSIDMAELYMECMKTEIHVDEVLCNIPINIFVPTLSEKIKNFLISNYDNLKTKFNITRLADWADINNDDLRNYLIELDANRGKQRLYKDENWQVLANTIIYQSIKHREAMNN